MMKKKKTKIIAQNMTTQNQKICDNYDIIYNNTLDIRKSRKCGY